MNIFLKLFLSFYGNLSVQLFSVKYNNPKSVLNLLWNLVLIYLGSRRIFRFKNSNQQTDPQLIRAFKENPLFSMLFDITTVYLHQISFLLNSAYFILISFQFQSSQLLFFLNVCFSKLQIFHSIFSSIKILFVLIIVHQICLMISIYPTSLFTLKKNQSVLKKLFDFLILLVLNTNTYIVCILTHLYKYCVIKSLEKIIKKYQKNGKNIQKLELEFKKLATQNFWLNNILSFPMFILFVPFVAEIIISFSFMWVTKLTSVDTYFFQFAFHLFFLAIGEFFVQKQLNQIENIFKNHYKLNKFKKFKVKMKICNLELMPLYQNHFQLRLFNLVNINFVFLFALTFFVLNYVIFIMQTSF